MISQQKTKPDVYAEHQFEGYRIVVAGFRNKKGEPDEYIITYWGIPPSELKPGHFERLVLQGQKPAGLNAGVWDNTGVQFDLLEEDITTTEQIAKLIPNLWIHKVEDVTKVFEELKPVLEH